MIFAFGGYTIDVDVAATKAFYESENARMTSEACRCDGCQNYEKAILQAGAGVLDFLKNLGIDPQKPGDVFGLCGKVEQDGTYFYGGWYHVVGTLLQSPSLPEGYRPDADFDFNVWITDDRTKMGWIEKNFPQPILEFSINTHLPYLI